MLWFPPLPPLRSVLCQSGDAPVGAGGDEEEDSRAEGLGGSVSVDGNFSFPPGCVRQCLLAVSQTLQPELGQEETVSRTGNLF